MFFIVNLLVKAPDLHRGVTYQSNWKDVTDVMKPLYGGAKFLNNNIILDLYLNRENLSKLIRN